MKSSLYIIALIHDTFGVLSKQLSLHPRSSRFSPMLSSKNFIVLHSTFRSMIHFELIFVKGVRSVISFFLHMDIRFSSTVFEETVFAPLYYLCFFVKDQLTISMRVFLCSLFCFIDLFVYFFANTALP